MAIERYILPASLFFGGLVIGFIFEKVILKILGKIASKTNWQGDDIIINAFKGWIVFLFIILGTYLAIINFNLNEKLLELIKKILIVLAIFGGTMVVAKIATGFVNLYQEKIKDVLPKATLFSSLTRFFILLLGGIIILQSLGISISPILAGLGVGGLAVALALQDTLSNLFSGLQIIVSRQIKIGDYIRLETGEEGYVVDINWRNTTIREMKNNEIIIPNSKLSQSIIKNFHLPEKELVVVVEVGVSYESDLEKVEKVTIEVAREVLSSFGISSFDPFIRYHTFADFSINFNVILRARDFADQFLVKHEFIKKLQKRFKEENIEIPYPIRTVHLKQY
ncbi:MAG: mechanosensitive ion channel family protein [Brevinematales bacterium]|nr:mechanosensitive ion channel family protein [Brevinematales bacterium]